MKILTTGSLFGNKRNYEELKSVMKVIHPDILIITGDIFPDEKESPLLQSDFLFDCKEYFLEYSKHCKHLLYIFGNTDIKCLDETFYSLLKEESDNILCLNHENFNYEGHTFMGLPYVGNHHHPLKDWLRQDSVVLDYIDEPWFYTTKDFDIVKNTIAIELQSYVDNLPSLDEILVEKLKNTLEHKIMISHFPPHQNHIDNYNFTLNSHLSDIDVLYVGEASEDEVQYNLTQEHGCNIITHGKEKNFLVYNINIIESGKLIYNYHPLNSNEDIFINGEKLRGWTNANKNRPKT